MRQLIEETLENVAVLAFIGALGAFVLDVAFSAETRAQGQSITGDGTIAEAQVTTGNDITAAKHCPIYDARDWRAWSAKGEDGVERLYVEGVVDVPTPGYTLTLTPQEPSTDGAPMALELTATAPAGVMIQMIATETVAFDMERGDVAAVTVRCAGVDVVELTVDD